MQYQTLLDQVKNLSFIENDEHADAAIKATLGILASKLDERHAQELAQPLPEPLTVEKLRSHQVRKLPLSADEYIAEIAAQFHIDRHQAESLVTKVIALTKDMLGDDGVHRIEEGLPEDWVELLERAA